MVVSPSTAATKVAKLWPTDKRIDDAAAAVSDQACIPLACIAPLISVNLILTSPYLTPAAAYTLLAAIAASWRHIWELSVNYPVFTMVLVIYHYIERIWRILVTPYILYNIYDHE